MLLFIALLPLAFANMCNEEISSEVDLQIVPREEWLAANPGPMDDLEIPVSIVIITHTATNVCTDKVVCLTSIRSMQTYHMNTRHFSDIAYNFLVGGDGSVYEGRGWDKAGAHTKGYNQKSIGIAMIGNFEEDVPSKMQLEALKSLLKYGVSIGKINEAYKLYGHRQLMATQSPGDNLFNEIAKWPHFVQKL